MEKKKKEEENNLMPAFYKGEETRENLHSV